MTKASPVMWLLGGAGAVWAASRWRDRKAARDDAWAADHDEDEIEPVREAAPVETRPGTTRALSRRYDGELVAYGQGLPLPYLRALAARESGLRADDPKGLINVVRVVREDYNARHGTRYQPKDLTSPAINITIAAETLRRIVDSYARHHPDVPNLQEDWSNRHFVELLTFGWNAGYSERAGVGRVARYLEQLGQTDITLADIAKNAHAAGASHWLWAHPKKVAWTRSVARLYVDERVRDHAAGLPVATAPPPAPVSDPAQVGG
ncbi:MAG: hypothetical protein KC464_00400 [Myxococcales bacterium]|nr:hypothetical protein [Myxococcales bacterium]